MIRARVALIGTGKQGDAFRVALPSYQLISTDEVTRTAIVDIPDDAYPTLPEGTVESVTTLPSVGRVVTAVDGATKADAQAFYDERYKEHAGKFSLDVK